MSDSVGILMSLRLCGVWMRQRGASSVIVEAPTCEASDGQGHRGGDGVRAWRLVGRGHGMHGRT
jgi:hypothetical protein